MMRSSWSKWLWDGRRSLGVWTVAICAVGALYAALWPTINDPDIQELLDSYPEGLLEALNYDDVSTSAGYLTASVYGLLAAVLLLVYAIGAGTRAIAGDEEAGRLELIVSHPISRSRLALGRFAALAAGVAVIVSVFWLLMLVMRPLAELDDISVGGFAAMHVHLAMFAIMFGAISYAVGAATGRRMVGLGVGAGAAVLGFLANGLLAQIDGFAWVANLSPFHWLTSGDPLRNGLQWPGTLAMLVVTALSVAAGTWAFGRRDIGT